MAVWINGYVKLNDGTTVVAHLTDRNCIAAGTCVCGFCKGNGQCEYGDCHNRLPLVGAGTLCLQCSASAFKAGLSGHRASLIPAGEVK